MYGACFGPAVILGLYWRRGNGTATIVSFVAGLGVLLTWNQLPFSDSLHQVFPAVGLSFLAYVLVALRTDGFDSPVIDALFHAEQTGSSSTGGVEAGIGAGSGEDVAAARASVPE